MVKSSPVAVLGTTLCFDRSGQRLAVVDRDGIAIVDIEHSRTRRLEQADARAVAVFDDQLWIATSDDHLLRLDDTGRAIGERIALPFAAAPLLVPAPCGPAAAAWGSAPPLAMYDDLGQLGYRELADADAVFPLAGRRHVAVRGAQVIMPSGIVTLLAPGAHVLGGAVMADGKSVTLLIAHGANRQLITVNLGTGRVTSRCAIAALPVRLAIRRALAIVQIDARRLCVLDLERGRELGSFDAPHDIGDFAIDPDGRRIASRDGDRVNIQLLAELATANVVVDEKARETRDAPDDIRQEVPEPAAATTRRDEPLARLRGPIVCPALVAFEPRARSEPVDRGGALAQLDRELRRVALWTLGAIANAWDTRRIGYGDEGRHPYELEVGAILGIDQGHAAEYVMAARDRLAEHERALADDVAWRTSTTPLGALSKPVAAHKCSRGRHSGIVCSMVSSRSPCIDRRPREP